MQRRLLLSALPLSVLGGRGGAQPRQLELASYFLGPALFANEIQRFADKLTEGSGGTLEVSVDVLGQTTPFAAMSKASALAHYYTGHHVDADPLLALSTLPTLVTTFDEVELLFRIARPSYDAALARHGQVLLATAVWRPATLFSTFPIGSAADLKGKGFTHSTSVGRRLGWHKPFLRIGAVEARDWEAELFLVGGVIDSLKFPRPFACFIELFYAAQLNFLTVSRDVFDSLTEAQRQLLVTTSRDAERSLWAAVKERVSSEHREMAQRNVVIAAQPPADLVAALRSAAEPDIQDWARATGAPASTILTEYRRAVGRT